MVHYSTGQELGRTDTAEWVREIQAYHQGHNGWSDIGYNYLVDVAGRVFVGRGRDAQGAHCSGSNRRAIGVCFLGNDDPGTQDATPAARAAIRSLHAQLERELGRQLAPVGHRDGFPTACPGDELYAWVHQGMPARGATNTPAPAAPASAPTASRAPRFPLPKGWYFGPKSGPRESVSGYYSHRADLRRLQDRLRYRGWNIGPVDGLWGPQTEGVVRAFQAEKGLAVDGRAGANTWAAAWSAPVTR